MGFAKAYRVGLSLVAALSLGACASGNGLGNAGAGGPTTTVAGQPSQQPRTGEDAAEAARPVPPDPYKSVQYRGGRDPVSGVAPGLDGELPPPPKAPARSSKTAAASTRSGQSIATTAVQGQTVEVKPGDTLFSIASRHKVPIAALKQANSMSTDKIVPGQRLILP